MHHAVHVKRVEIDSLAQRCTPVLVAGFAVAFESPGARRDGLEEEVPQDVLLPIDRVVQEPSKFLVATVV